MHDGSVKWWEEPNGQSHEAVFHWLRLAEQDQSGFNNACMQWLQDYTRRPTQSTRYIRRVDDVIPLDVNVVASIIRTLRAKITKNRPAVMAVTDGASQELQDKAEGLTRFVGGIIYQAKGYEKGERVFDDACLYGMGVAKVYSSDNTIRLERVYPWEIFVVAQDAHYGEPRTLAQVKNIDRAVLAALYPDQQEQIATCDASAGDAFWGFNRNRVDQLRVCETWHLPSSAKAQDGRHVIAIANATLVDEEWTRDRFPFAVLRIEPDPVGWQGTGVSEEIGPIQEEIDAVLGRIQDAHDRLGNTFIAVEAGSKVDVERLKNLPATIIEYVGQPPIPITPPVVAPDVYQYLESLIQRAYQIYGISQLSAQSQKQPGLNSGAAIRTQHDVESERYSYVSRAYERFFLDLAELFIDEAHAMGGKCKALCRSADDSFSTVNWSDVDLDRESFVLQMFPTSFLPSTPAGRMETVSDMVQSGIVSPQEGRMLLDMPDLKGRLDPWEANYRLVRYQIDGMLKRGEAAIPEPYQNLQECIRLALAAYCRAQTYDDVPEDNRELLRQYIENAQARLNPPQTQQPQPDQQMQPAPQQDMGIAPQGVQQ